jgi:outer membrane protein assembly factor BamB
MITSISSSITQNVGQLQNTEQPQNIGQPTSSSSGTGGLADSPWPMFRQNLKHTGLSPYDTSGNLGNLRWSFTTNGRIYGGPVIDSNGIIYVGSQDDNLYAINPDGTEKWNFTTGYWVGSTPAIGSDNTIYVGSVDHKFYAINPDGTEKWNFTTGDNIHSSPTIGFDGTIYIGSYDRNMYAINPNGSEKWHFTTGGNIDSSPAIDSNGTIYFGSKDGKLYAINPDGTEKWSFVVENWISATPAIGVDGTIYVGSNYDNKLYAINPDGTEKWSFMTDNHVKTPGIGSDGTIYVGSSNSRLYAINPNGTEKWSYITGGVVASSPAIGSDGTIFVGSHDYNIYAINPDGTAKWSFTTGNFVSSSPAIGCDGVVYVGSQDFNLYAIGSSPNLDVSVTSHFSSLNSAAQSAITVHVTDGTNPVQGATVNLVSDNGGIFSPQSGITDANGDFKSIFNAPTVTTQIICRISAEASKTGYNDGSGYVDVTINPVPWPMFRHNLNHTGLSPYDTSANNGQLKWSFATEGYIISSPAIGADGTIYVGSFDHKLYAINPDGTEKWNFKTGSFVDDSSPAIGSDGTIYIGSRDNKLYAINPDGTEKWNFTTGHDISSSPAIGADGTIYVGSNDDKLYAIYPDGTEKWSFTAGDVIRSSPAIGFDGTIYVGSGDHKLYSINSDGTEKWNFTTGFVVISSPAIGSDGTIYIGSSDKNLYAINPDGTEKWNFSTNGQLTSSPAIGSDGTIYIGSADDYVYAINPDGTEKWSFYTGLYHDVVSSPAIGFDGTIYIGSCSKKLHAVNPNGTEKWNFTTGSYIHSSPAIGTDGTIYIGSGDNNLYAIGGLAQKQPPDANAGLDQIVNEGDTVQFDASASSDPDGTITTYEWDFDATDDLWWETGAFPDATGPTPTHTYGDDGVFVVTLRVTDNDNLSATDTCNVTVQNVNPTVTIESLTMDVEIGLRVAGRKYNNVSMALYEDGSSIGYVSIERMPGSPDEQIAWIPVSINFSSSYNATVTYIPEDPPNVGGNPVWIYLKSKNGSINKIHHTFNVQQSKKRDSEHWNHVDPWEVDLNGHFIGLSFEITSHVTDPGSDDEYLTFTYGSQIKTVTYLNNPPNPDSYPSPEVNPVNIMDTIILIYEGPGTVTLVVKDDDNIRLGVGEGTSSFDVG